jgi:hypothetical protein
MVVVLVSALRGEGMLTAELLAGAAVGIGAGALSTAAGWAMGVGVAAAGAWIVAEQRGQGPEMPAMESGTVR